MERAHNFFAGPAVLPVQVIEAASAAVTNFNNLNMGVIEISHRSKDFQAVVDEAVADLKEVMNIPDNYKVVFLTGGASTQFAMIPMNLMKGSADYVDTGAWSTKAIKEAKLFGDVNVVYSGKEAGFKSIPKEFDFNADASYVHLTSNNTIHGTQIHDFPSTGDVPLICDMSSDIMCRKVDVSKFGYIYAGAQKNMGAAGVAVGIIREDLLDRVPSNIPTMFKYTTHVSKGSMFNTPPVYAIYIVGQVLKWIKGLGGIDAIEKINVRKAGMLYDVLDKYEIYQPQADKDCRSLMNVTWTMTTKELEAELLAEAAKNNMYGMKGHRSVGGLRASIYNACPEASVAALCKLLEEFAQKH